MRSIVLLLLSGAVLDQSASENSVRVFVASLRTGVEDLKEQNLELAGSVVSYDVQLHELEKENLRLRKSVERLSRSSLRGEKSCMS